MRRLRDQTKRHEASNPCRSPRLITELAETVEQIVLAETHRGQIHPGQSGGHEKAAVADSRAARRRPVLLVALVAA
jgi:hypothetical protein